MGPGLGVTGPLTHSLGHPSLSSSHRVKDRTCPRAQPIGTPAPEPHQSKPCTPSLTCPGKGVGREAGVYLVQEATLEGQVGCGVGGKDGGSFPGTRDCKGPITVVLDGICKGAGCERGSGTQAWTAPSSLRAEPGVASRHGAHTHTCMHAAYTPCTRTPSSHHNRGRRQHRHPGRLLGSARQ